MTKLDDALALGVQDPKAQPLYYDLFLNSLFFVPIIEEEEKQEKQKSEEGDEGALPLLVQANGKEYLMLFDTIKRLTEWADEKVKYVALPGHAVTEMSLPNLYWAMNYGTEHQKMFEPKEIAWLKDIVRQAKENEPEEKAQPQSEKK
ncbi:SseB family protein [Malonomonas rubra]|uniref:SseB family protein n=1 Tax=Malonomonas rubra TaxID=57040 RepID=UPI0026EB3317|nr:SseB family protein [Malonomonas rubra]